MKRLEQQAVAAWWQIAESDLRVARILAAIDPPVWRHVCFNCQQAAEKALKGVLEAESLVIPRTHDLVTLVDLLLPLHPDVDDIIQASTVLSEYGVGPRYPSVEGEATAEDASEALEFAAAILEWAAGKLEKQAKEPA